MAPRAHCRILFVGEGVENDLRVTAIEQTAHGFSFRLDGQRYSLPMIGRHNLTNALCALAIGKEIGIAGTLLAESLAEFEPVAGRSHLSRIGSWTVMDDTYNASPTAFAAALQSFSDWPQFARGRRIVIAGDMLELGDAAAEEHCRLGQRIGRMGIDRLLVTGSHADDVALGALSAGMPSHRIAAAKDWNTLLFLLECWLEPGDAVLVKGSRGMRMERIIEWMKSASQSWNHSLLMRNSA